MSSGKNDDIVLAGIGLCAGPVLFWKGFNELKLKKLVEGLATSKARSLAMGTVELCGKADALAPARDPIYGKDAVSWRILIEERRGSGKNSRWVTIHTDDTTSQPFWCVDETGRVLVQPANADKRYKTDVSVGTGLFANADPQVSAYIQGTVGTSMNSRRMTARIIRPGDPLYVLGCAMPLEQRPSWIRVAKTAVKATLQDAVRLLKRDAARMRALDVNRDGVVDPQEWDAGVQRLKEELAKGEPAPESSPEDFVASAVVRDGSEVFIVADETESELVGELSGSAWLMIVGGPLLCVACAAYLAVRLKLLPGD